VRREQIRRLERLEAHYRGDSLEALGEFRLAWIEPLREGTPVPRGGRIVRDSWWEDPTENWLRPGLRFRFGRVRERVANGPDDQGQILGEPDDTPPAEGNSR
jgi:hypothetical protein